MATVTPKANPEPWKSSVPLLYSGDSLSQPEFHRRYEAYPKAGVRFELIGGIVYMMAPAGFDHGGRHFDIGGVLSLYTAATPGVAGAHGPTVILDQASEPEPDCVLLIKPEYGGRTKLKTIGKKNYIEGGPEFVLEVAHSTVSIDLHAKRKDYQRAGVLEYVVICIDEQIVRWFDPPSGKELELPSDGVLRSRVLPGLWIDTSALFAGDSQQLIDTVQAGIATPEHQKFVEALSARQRGTARQVEAATKKTTKPKRKRK